MRIQTLSRDYEIIQILQRDERKECLIVKTADLAKTEKYMFMILKQKEDIRRFVSFCADLKENKAFDDFLDFFPRDGHLYMLYRYYDCESLEERALADGVSLKERLSIARNMIQRMVFLNTPLYLQYEALDWSNLRADENGMVYFNYRFFDMEKFGQVSVSDIWNRISEILTHLFAEELENESCPSLEHLIEQIEAEKFKNYMELLQTYEPIYKELLALHEKNEIKPRALGFRIWERLKAIAKRLKYVAMLLVIGALLWYLADTIINPSYGGGDVLNYKSIGTLEIREQTGQSAE